jgi:alpha-beta hydrolase superfamily lysophospholipase
MDGSIRLISDDGTLLDAVVELPSREPYRGTVVLAHGIACDLEEDGVFGPLTQELTSHGFVCLRFSFRGHGRSGGLSQDITITGEIMDLGAAVRHAQRRYPGPLAIVAASFGTVSTALLLPEFRETLKALVLWYPVLDVAGTFLHPHLPWGVANFGADSQAAMAENGFLLIDGWFKISRDLYDEFTRYDPVPNLMDSSVPTLVVQGDHDSYVSCHAAQDFAQQRPGTNLNIVEGAEHGFDTPHHLREAIRVTTNWLVERRRNGESQRQ